MSTFYYNYFNPCTPFPRERQRGRETRETEREKKTDRQWGDVFTPQYFSVYLLQVRSTLKQPHCYYLIYNLIQISAIVPMVSFIAKENPKFHTALNCQSSSVSCNLGRFLRLSLYFVVLIFYFFFFKSKGQLLCRMCLSLGLSAVFFLIRFRFCTFGSSKWIHMNFNNGSEIPFYIGISSLQNLGLFYNSAMIPKWSAFSFFLPTICWPFTINFYI